MEFVKNFTPPDSQAKNFTPSISTVLVGKKQKNSENGENGEIYTAGKNFTLPPAVTAWTNSTSGVWKSSVHECSLSYMWPPSPVPAILSQAMFYSFVVF